MTDAIWGIPVLWYRRLFYLSLPVTLLAMLIALPPSAAPPLVNDKLAHVVIFFIITLLCSRGLRPHYGLMALFWLALFGLFIEISQAFTPWRSFSWLDWIADIVGILSYHCLYLIKLRRATKRS